MICTTSLFLAAALCWVPQFSGRAITGVTVQPQGLQGDAASFVAFEEAISFDGRLVLFDTSASNIPGGDSPGVSDVYLWDRTTNSFEWISQTNGTPANGTSTGYSLAGNGSFVLFSSRASNLVIGDTNGQPDAFLYDRITNTLERVSLNSQGMELARNSIPQNLDDSGGFIVFKTVDSNVLPGDNNNRQDVFIRDRVSGMIWLGAPSYMGGFPQDGSSDGLISGDGSTFAFDSFSSDIVPNDNNSTSDVFYRSFPTGNTIRISLTFTGGPTTAGSEVQDISTDGRFIVFTSLSNNIVPGDNNGFADVFVYDTMNLTVTRASLGLSGQEPNAGCGTASISDDGRYVMFESAATNLVANPSMGFGQIYVRDLAQNTTVLVSSDVHGNAGNGFTLSNHIARNGLYGTFNSSATSLVPRDLNGGIRDVFAVSHGELFDYGNGCAGSGGFVPELLTHGLPSSGSLMTYVIENGLGRAPTWLYFGLARASIPLGGGCDLFLGSIMDNSVFFFLNGSGPGNGTVALPVQVPVGSAPGTFYVQAFSFDPGASPGFTVTNAIQVSVP